MPISPATPFLRFWKVTAWRWRDHPLSLWCGTAPHHRTAPRFACRHHHEIYCVPGHSPAMGGAYMIPVVKAQETAMTPEERNLIIELFDRLATLEDAARDPEAERA